MTDPILLPSTPALKTDRPRMLDYGGALTPQLGGVVQTLQRLGTRHALDFTLPPMLTEPHGRIWGAKLRQAKLYGAVLPFGQDGFDVGNPGNVVVDGSGQAGSMLDMRGFTPGYLCRYGQAFSLVHAGRRYLHFIGQDDTGADGAGVSIQAIFPMLRVIPSDGDVLEFLQPKIQGSLSGNEVAWDRQSAPWSDFGTITITEDA